MEPRQRSRVLTAAFVIGLISTTAGAAVFQQTGSGMAGYWTFDEASGTTAADSSGNGNTLTYAPIPSGPVPSATVPTVAFTDPQSLSFDGTATYVSNAALSGFPAGNTVHTTAGWIQVTSLPTNRAWILLLGNAAAGNEHWLIDSTGVTQFGVWGGGQVAPKLGVGVWHHVALTYDGTTLTGYLDGSSIGSVAASYNFAGVPLTVAQAHNGENFFNGLVDDLRIYTRVLSAAEISSLAAGNSGPAAPTGLTATAGDTQVTLTWGASAGPGTVVYNVKRSTTSGGSPPGTYTTIASNLSTTNYVDTGLTNGTPYYYLVTAVSFGEGPNSVQAGATPNAPKPRTQTSGGTHCGCGSTHAPGLTPLLAFLSAALTVAILTRRR